MTRLPKVSIIILNWDGLKDAILILKDLGGITVSGFIPEVIIVDNGSSDGSQEQLANFKLPNMPYRFIETGANLGFAGGNNIGMKDAIKRGSDYLLLLNSDVIIPKDILVQLIKVAEKDHKIGLLSPKMYFAKGYEFHKDRYKRAELGKVFWYAGGLIDRDNIYSSHRGVDEVDDGQYNQEENTDIANGACVLIRRKVLKDIGYLREKYFMYWEDADLSERARRAGWKIVYTPATHLWHKVSQSSGIGSNLNDYFLTRNRLDFGMRYASFRTKLALIRESIRMFFNGREWQKIGTKDYYLGKFGKGSWGKK